MINGTTWLGGQEEVNSACEIRAVHMYFNRTGIRGGETRIIIPETK